MKRVAFVCTHNSCRSQIAEALCKLISDGALECYSAGTFPGDAIDPTACRIVLEMFGVDMTLTQSPKSTSDIPPVDIVITMGCISGCPVIKCDYHEDWGLPDPTGGDDGQYVAIIREIESKMTDLVRKVVSEQV